MNPEEFYRNEFLRIEKHRIDQAGKLDNIIFVLGTGIFVLSINYITGNKGYLFLPWLLIVSWIFIVLAILIHAVGYSISVSTASEHLSRMKEWARGNFHPPNFDLDNDAQLKRLRVWIDRLNEWSFITLLIGIVTLTFFVSFNFIAHNSFYSLP